MKSKGVNISAIDLPILSFFLILTWGLEAPSKWDICEETVISVH